MSPKKWCNVVKITEGQTIEVLKNHSKAIRRLGWKAMDPSEFSESFFSLCKAIAEHTVRVSSVKLRSAISKQNPSWAYHKLKGTCWQRRSPTALHGQKTNFETLVLGSICQPQWKGWGRPGKGTSRLRGRRLARKTTRRWTRMTPTRA